MPTDYNENATTLPEVSVYIGVVYDEDNIERAYQQDRYTDTISKGSPIPRRN